MGAVGGHRQLGRHAGMADGVGAGHLGEAEALRHRRRQADLLVELHPVAAADEVDLRRLAEEPCGELVGVPGGDGDDDMGVVMGGARVGKRGEDAIGRGGDCRLILAAERELGGVAPPFAVDGEAGAVGPAIGQRREHRRGQSPELGLEALVLQEQTDDAAHDGKRSAEVISRLMYGVVARSSMRGNCVSC